MELEAARAKFDDDKKTEEWAAISWKKKYEASASQYEIERKRFVEACERDNNEKITLCNEI